MKINKNVKIRHKVTLNQEERAQLMQIIKKGGHKSQKVGRALILLNCDESEYCGDFRPDPFFLPLFWKKLQNPLFYGSMAA